MLFAAPVGGLILAVILGLIFLRLVDSRAEHREWARLAALQPASPARFDPAMIAGLPEPARRFLTWSIAPGAPLRTVAEIEMNGQFSLASGTEPAWRPMRARQILAAPHGFVWRARIGGGAPISGSDTASWTRFRILGLIPVARIGGRPDHARAAFGRCVAEAVFWTPAAFLPGPGIRWEAPDAATARVTVTHGALAQTVDLTLDATGRPDRVVFQRWTDANPGRTYRLQPFGGVLSDFREVAGFRLPFRVEAGNMFGTPDHAPFYRAEVTAIGFPDAQ